MRVKCLAQEHERMFDPESSELTMRPPRLQKVKLNLNKIAVKFLLNQRLTSDSINRQ